MVQETRSDHARLAGRIRARLVFTLIGAAALVVGAFLDLEPETTVFRPPTPSEISVGAKGEEGRGSEESSGG